MNILKALLFCILSCSIFFQAGCQSTEKTVISDKPSKLKVVTKIDVPKSTVELTDKKKKLLDTFIEMVKEHQEITQVYIIANTNEKETSDFVNQIKAYIENTELKNYKLTVQQRKQKQVTLIATGINTKATML